MEKYSSITNHNKKVADAVEWKANNQNESPWLFASFNAVTPFPLIFS